MKAFVVAAGHVQQQFIQKRIRDFDYLVAVDGGMKALQGYHVHLFVGDMDSVERESIHADDCVFLEKEKDETDLEAALDLLVEKGITEMTVAGAFGSRMDHVLTSVLMISKKKASIALEDENNILFVKKESFLLEKKEGYFFSLIPLEEVEISIRGSKYELEKRKVEVGETLLVSNEFKSNQVSIEFEKGSVLVLYSRD